MQRHDYPRTTDALWQGASTADSWIAIVSRAFLFLGRTVPVSRLYAVVSAHPKAKGKRNFWRHHTNDVLERFGATVRLDADIWQLISERPSRLPDSEVSVARPRGRPRKIV